MLFIVYKLDQSLGSSECINAPSREFCSTVIRCLVYGCLPDIFDYSHNKVCSCIIKQIYSIVYVCVCAAFRRRWSSPQKTSNPRNGKSILLFELDLPYSDSCVCACVCVCVCVCGPCSSSISLGLWHCHFCQSFREKETDKVLTHL